MAAQQSLLQYKATGGIDIQASINVAEDYYGTVSSALNAGLSTGGKNIQSALDMLGAEHIDVPGIMSVGVWMLQNLPMPAVLANIGQATLQIATMTEEGAAIGGSVLAFTGAGAPLGAAAGAIVGAFMSLKGLFGHSAEPVPSTFDYAQSVIPLPASPEDIITKPQVDRIIMAVPPGAKNAWASPGTGMSDLADAFHGEKDTALKIANAYWHFFDILNLPVSEQLGLAHRQAQANGPGDQTWGQLDRAAAQVAVYSVNGDGRMNGRFWTDLDWFNYLVAYRRSWERIVQAQEGAHPLLGGHRTPHHYYVDYLIAKFSGVRLPNAISTAAGAKNAQSQLPALARAVLQASKKKGGSPAHHPPNAGATFKAWVDYYLDR